MENVIKKITQLVSEGNPIGKYDPECELLSFVEDEMMKIGTLNHGSIDWSEVEAKSITYLSTKCKNFKVLSYLMICLQRDGAPERFLSSIKSLNAFLQKYWLKSYPKPGRNGLTNKIKLLKVIVSKIIDDSKKLEVFESDAGLAEQYNKTIEKIEENLTKKEINSLSLVPVIQNFNNSLEKNSKTTGKTQKPSNDSEPKPSQLLDNISLSDERKVKQAYLSIAKFTNEIEPGNPVGYQIRRFGLWLGIKSLPHINNKGLTEMSSVPDDKIFEYAETAKTDASFELLGKIETTIISCPFWIGGNYIAALCAQNISCENISDTIKTSTTEFLDRFPGLVDCKFSDGSPFVDESTKNWLFSYKNDKHNEIDDNLKSLTENKSMEESLIEIEKRIKKSSNIREKYYLRLISAELLHKSKMMVLASTQSKQIQHEISRMKISDWEPGFISRLELIDYI